MNSYRDETISALADGQLTGSDFESALEQAAKDPHALAQWETYHLVGDVMRQGAAGAPLLDSGFTSRLMLRLADEEPLRMPAPEPITGLRAHEIDRPAANQESFYWRIVAGLTMVGLVCWAGLGSLRDKSDTEQAASQAVAVPEAVQTASNGSAMIRDPRLDEFLAAHRQAGGASALQMPSGFLRNATFQGTAR